MIASGRFSINWASGTWGRFQFAAIGPEGMLSTIGVNRREPDSGVCHEVNSRLFGVIGALITVTKTRLTVWKKRTRVV